MPQFNLNRVNLRLGKTGSIEVTLLVMQIEFLSQTLQIIFSHLKTTENY